MKSEIVFSIYMIDKEKVRELMGAKTKNVNTILELLVKKLHIDFNNREKDNCDIYEASGYTCMVINKSRILNWNTFIRNNFDVHINLANDSYSYLLFRIVDDEIFVMTGGYSASAITKFVIKDFGINLIPRLFKEDDSIIKSLATFKTAGKYESSDSTLTSNSSFLDEEDISSIPAGAHISTTYAILEEFGIKVSEKESDITLILEVGDSLVIRKSFNIDELTLILESLPIIYSREPNFFISPLVPVKDFGISKTDLFDIMVDNFLGNHKEVKITIPFNFLNSNNNVRVFKLLYGDEESENFNYIDIDLVYGFMMKVNKRMSKTFVKDFFKKAKVEFVCDNAPNFIQSLFKFMITVFDYEGKTVYLQEDRWLAYRLDSYDFLRRRYYDIFDYSQSCLEKSKIFKTLGIVKCEELNEDSYNNSFKENNNVIVVHKSLYKKVEFADLIFWDDTNIYFMCNKSGFGNTGVRDLIPQILVAEQMFRGVLNSGDKLLASYYNTFRDEEKNKISESDFIALFNNRKVVFIAGFSSDFRRNHRSVYCHGSLKILKDDLNRNDFDLIVMNYLNL